VRRGHESVPEGYRPRETAGLMYGLVVEDAAAEAKRLSEAGVELVTPVVDEVYGQRHFSVADPDGVLLDVIEMIPVDPEWAAANTPAP
jgi:uncharacterized glyoxalase superfamily protein PhnB